MGSDERSHEPACNTCPTLSRRGLFQFPALAIASSALPSGSPLAQPYVRQDPPLPSPAASPLMERLSSYMSQAATRPLPEEVVEKAKHHVLDTMLGFFDDFLGKWACR